MAEHQRQTRLQMLHWSMPVVCFSHSNRTASTAPDSVGMNDRARSIYSQLASQLASKLPRRMIAEIPVRHHRKCAALIVADLDIELARRRAMVTTVAIGEISASPDPVFTFIIAGSW